MDITLWGVRGSISSSSCSTQYYGSNTSCIELRTNAGDLLIFDAGSGLHLLSETLPDSGVCHLFITHGHFDHLNGLGFFKPFYNPNWTIHLYLPEWLEDMPSRYFDGNFFPVPLSALKGKVITRLIIAGESFEVETETQTINIDTFATNHPGRNLAYKVHADDVSFVYTGDHEITNNPAIIATTQNMLKGANIAVVDASYNRSDYQKNWGHSKWEDWVELSNNLNIDCLVLSHHLPERTDLELDKMQEAVVKLNNEKHRSIVIARESMNFHPPQRPEVIPQKSNWLEEFIKTLSRYKEENTILDRILAETRRITAADAGTVFLRDDNELIFAYTHNDSLFNVDIAYKHSYLDMRIPCSLNSIAGYVATTGESLNIADVRDLPADAPYKFNHSFDEKTGYNTKSILAIPFFDSKHNCLGVLQLINSLNLRTREPQAFSFAMLQNVKTLAVQAASTLELSSVIRESIKQVLGMATLHDPTETGPHAERVGSIAAELYQRFAEKKKEEPEELRYTRNLIRLAAMLHDLGKVGISDTILKKAGKLTDEEFNIMRNHPTMGAKILTLGVNDITDLAHEIALHHHQKWNGKGYYNSDPNATLLSGNEIPLAARITSIADVFDALVSPRCYKEPWPFENALALLHRDAGSHFDPNLIDCFCEITDTIKDIYKRFPDKICVE